LRLNAGRRSFRICGCAFLSDIVHLRRRLCWSAGGFGRTAVHLHHCFATPKQLPCLFSTPFSPIPQGGHHRSPIQSPMRSLCHADNASGRRTSGATEGGFDPHPPSLQALPRPFLQRNGPYRTRRCGARRRRPPPRRAPSEPPSASRPRVRGGGGAPLTPRPRAHARRLGTGGGSRCARPGAPSSSASVATAACRLPLPGGAGGVRRCGCGDHRGGRHRQPSRAHSRSVDGTHPLAGRRTIGSEGQGRECPNPGPATRRREGRAMPAAAPPWAARPRSTAGGRGGARRPASATAAVRDGRRRGGGAEAQPWL